MGLPGGPGVDGDPQVVAARPSPSPRPARGKPDPCQPAADATERAILESLADPQLRALSVEQRCDLLGISRSTWYRHTSEDPLFRARALVAYRTACDDQLGPVLNALCESAKLHGREGHQDRKLYLELLGIHDEQAAARKRREEEETKPSHNMTDQELIDAFAGREHLLPPGVQRRLGIDPDAGKGTPTPTTPANPARKAA
ncbi:MAG TPA: hypothetical protein VG269_26725 [Tepidisphaeraceae bacterium]|nr:hypothetical protein [Tepidisphaeraceae bacterium]